MIFLSAMPFAGTPFMIALSIFGHISCFFVPLWYLVYFSCMFYLSCASLGVILWWRLGCGLGLIYPPCIASRFLCMLLESIKVDKVILHFHTMDMFLIHHSHKIERFLYPTRGTTSLLVSHLSCSLWMWIVKYCLLKIHV